MCISCSGRPSICAYRNSVRTGSKTPEIAVSEEAPGVKGVCGVCWSVSRLECSGARDAREPPLMPVEAVSGWEGRSRPACQGRP